MCTFERIMCFLQRRSTLALFAATKVLRLRENNLADVKQLAAMTAAHIENRPNWT